MLHEDSKSNVRSVWGFCVISNKDVVEMLFLSQHLTPLRLVQKSSVMAMLKPLQKWRQNLQTVIKPRVIS